MRLFPRPPLVRCACTWARRRFAAGNQPNISSVGLTSFRRWQRPGRDGGHKRKEITSSASFRKHVTFTNGSGQRHPRSEIGGCVHFVRCEHLGVRARTKVSRVLHAAWRGNGKNISQYVLRKGSCGTL